PTGLLLHEAARRTRPVFRRRSDPHPTAVRDATAGRPLRRTSTSAAVERTRCGTHHPCASDATVVESHCGPALFRPRDWPAPLRLDEACLTGNRLRLDRFPATAVRNFLPLPGPTPLGKPSGDPEAPS